LGGGEIGLVESLMRAAYPPWLRRATGQWVTARSAGSQGLALTTSCLAHPLRRGHQLISDAVAGQAKTPHAVPRLFEHALVLQEGRDVGSLAAATLAAEVGPLNVDIPSGGPARGRGDPLPA